MIKPRYYQSAAKRKVFEYIRHNKGKHPLIAIPTGAGKTIIIADIINTVRAKWPDAKIMVLSHVKEILEQNYNKVVNYLDQMATEGSIKIYSAGLGQKEIGDVTVAGIQSIYRRPKLVSHKKLIIIDECHLISNKSDSMYRKLFDEIPDATYLGLTATPYRLGTGKIYGEDALFDDLVYDLTSMDNFNKLVDEGYLCKLVAKATKLKMEIDDIGTVAGDYNEKQMSLKFSNQAITEQAIDEIIAKGKDRKKWLIFGIDIKHAELIAETLIRKGIPTNVIHSKMEQDRSEVINNFKAGKYRALVNVNVLTTGFDDPEIDLIGLMRPTKSPVLHVQTIGRGLRIHDDKEDCLVLDFAGNVARLGPINNVVVHKARKGKGGGEPIMKECPSCSSLVFPAVRICPDCGHKFEFKQHLSNTAGSKDIVARNEARWYTIDEIMYTKHERNNAPRSMKVSYICAGQVFNEWVCVEHTGYAKHKANHWLNWRETDESRNGYNGSRNNVDDLIENVHLFKEPSKISVKKGGKYPEIVDFYF